MHSPRGSRTPAGRGAQRRIGVAALCLLLLTLLAGCGGKPAPVSVSSAAASPTPAETETATATPVPSPTKPPDPSVTVTSLAEFRKDYGDPPGANMGHLRIPLLGVDAPIGARVVGGDGVMPDPSGPTDTVWYEFSLWPGYGGAPGGSGNAVFSGHVDYAAVVPYAGVQYRGKGVFGDIRLLHAGDEIEVESGGRVSRYRVNWARSVPSDSSEWATLMKADPAGGTLTLITCGGTFNYATREYSERTVVRATRS